MLIIACALNEGCPIISLDGGLIHAAKVAGVDVLDVEQDDDNSS